MIGSRHSWRFPVPFSGKLAALLSTLIVAAAVAMTGCNSGGSSSSSTSGTSNPPPPSVTVSVSPSSANVLLGNTQQFTATVTGSSNTSVTWSVSGVAGGNSTVGTITADGVYTAPADLPNPASVTVTATSQASSSASANSTVSVTSDIQVTVQASSSSVQTSATLQLTATVTSSGHPDQSVTWSVDGVAGGNSTDGTITSTGTDTATYTAPTTVPSPSNVNIAATSVADAAQSASATETVFALSAKLQISSLSETSAKPFDSLTVQGTGFQDGVLALSVLFTPENGDSPLMVPVSASDLSSVQAMVPVFADSSGNFVAETVDVQVIGISTGTVYLSNTIQGLQVGAPPAPNTSAPVGARTAALLSAALNISQTVETAQSGNSGFSAATTALNQSNNDVSALLSAIGTLENNPSDSVALAEADGTATMLNTQMLGQSDSIAEALVSAIMSQASIPVAGSSSNCPVTGDQEFDNDLCSIQTYFQALASQGTTASQSRLRLGSFVSPALTPPDRAVLILFANLALGGLAELADPPGGALIYEMAIAPVVTATISSLAVDHETPSGTDVAAAVGLKTLDMARFQGVPVAGTVVDEILAIKALISYSPPQPGIMLSSGTVISVPGQPGENGYEVILDPNTGQAVTLMQVPSTPAGGSIDSTTLALPPPSTPYTLTAGVSSGDGSIQSFPTGLSCGSSGCSASYPAGQVVQITAIPADGQSLKGWSGDCSGVGPCVVTMDSDRTVSASFGAGQTYSGDFSAPFDGVATDPGGDTYSATMSGTITLDLTVGTGGSVSGSANVLAYIGDAVVSCPGGDCTATPFTESAATTVSGTTGAFTIDFTSSDGFNLTFSGSQNTDGTITGSITFSQQFAVTYGGSSSTTTLSGSAPSVTLSPQ